MRHLLLTLLATMPTAAAQPDQPAQSGTDGKAAAVAPEKKSLTSKLERKVTLEFSEVPLRETIAFLQQIGGVNIVLDPSCTRLPACTIKVQNLQLGSALKLLTKSLGATFEIHDDFIYKTADSGKASKESDLITVADDPTAGKLAKKLEEMKVTLEFEEAPFEAVIDYMRHLNGLNIVVDPRSRIRASVLSLTVQDLSLRKVLYLVCRLAGGKINIGEVIYITDGPRAAKAKPEPAPSGVRLKSGDAVLETSRVVLTSPSRRIVEIEGIHAEKWAPRLIDRALDTAADGILVYRVSRDLRGVVDKNDAEAGKLKALAAKIAPGAEIIRRDDLLIVLDKDPSALRRIAAVIRHWAENGGR
jgi:hypothetical protein